MGIGKCLQMVHIGIREILETNKSLKNKAGSVKQKKRQKTKKVYFGSRILMFFDKIKNLRHICFLCFGLDHL